MADANKEAPSRQTEEGKQPKKKFLTYDDLGVAEINGRGWAIVSGDLSKPLTHEQASEILTCYLAAAELLHGR